FSVRAGDVDMDAPFGAGEGGDRWQMRAVFARFRATSCIGPSSLRAKRSNPVRACCGLLRRCAPRNDTHVASIARTRGVGSTALTTSHFLLLYAAMLVAAAGNTALQSVMPAIGREIGIADFWVAIAYTWSA